MMIRMDFIMTTELYIKLSAFTLYCLAVLRMANAEKKVRELMDEKI